MLKNVDTEPAREHKRRRKVSEVNVGRHSIHIKKNAKELKHTPTYKEKGER
jgi:hypothetical protein